MGWLVLAYLLCYSQVCSVIIPRCLLKENVGHEMVKSKEKDNFGKVLFLAFSYITLSVQSFSIPFYAEMP